MTCENNVVISPEIRKPRIELMKAPVGSTITQILRAAIAENKMDAGDLPYVEIRINGFLLPRTENALDTVLLDGQTVQISMAVRGDNPLKTAFNILVQVTAAVVGFFFGPWAAAAVQVVGGLLSAALFRTKRDSLAEANDASALNEQSNTIRRRQPMPLVLGKQRVAFDVAALSYTQNINDESWLNVIFGIHYGKCRLDDVKIGETLLADYPASDYQVEYFLTPGPRNSSLYPGNVYQENFNNKLEFAGIPGGTWEVVNALPAAIGAEVDITWPAGLAYNTDKGKIRNEEVALQIQIAPVGSESWQAAPFPGNETARDKNNNLLPPGSFYINMKTANAIRRTFKFPLDKNTNWKIRVRAYDVDNDTADDPGHTWDTYLTAVRSIFDGKPILDENLSCMVLRIKASGDIGNTLPTISAEVTPIVPIYSGGNWNTEAPTSNHAALLRWCLTDLPAANPLPVSQINASCATVYNLIEARGWHAGLLVTEEGVSQEDLMRMCGVAGRFATYWSGEDLCFIGDWEKPIPRQVFAAANISGYKYRREFQTEIHAVLVEFSNVDEDSRSDEVWVYADGYDANTATLFETYRLQYSTTKTRAFKEGRVYLARRELKTETHEWIAAFDSVTATFGDRVKVSHYAALYGESSGRVIARLLDPSNTQVLGVRVDFEATQEVGQSYSVDIRTTEPSVITRLLEPVASKTVGQDLWFAAPMPVADGPMPDDLIIFGKTNQVTEDVEIDRFEPQSRYEVKISASPYVASQIEAAENGPIPPLPTNLLPKPVVPAVRILQRYGHPSGVKVVFDVGPSDTNPIEGFVARWRYSGSGQPWNAIGIIPPFERTVTTPPIDSAAFDVDYSEPTIEDPVSPVTYIDVQIITLSRRGDYSSPTTALNIPVEKDVPLPQDLDAITVVRTSPDQTAWPVIAVIANSVVAGDVQYLEVEFADVAMVDGVEVPDQEFEWYSAGSPLPAANPIGDFTDVKGGQSYKVRARFRTQDNWVSLWVYVPETLTVPINSLVASDVITVGGRPVGDFSDLPERVDDLNQQVDIVLIDVAQQRIDITAIATGLLNNGIAITQEATIRENEDQQIAELISFIGQKNATGTAFILDQDTVMVSLTETMAQRLTLIESRFAGTAASHIYSTAQTAASDAEASVNALTEMGVDFGNLSGFQLDSSKIKVSPTETLSQRLISVGAQLDDAVSETQVDARVNILLEASIDAGGPIANWMAATYTTIDDFTATSGFLSTAVNGLEARASMFVDVNGRIGGVNVGADQETIDLEFLFERVFFVDATSGSKTRVLDYVGGQWTFNSNVRITGDLIVDGTIRNEQIENNTITGLSATYTAGAVTLTGTTPVVVAEVWTGVEKPDSPVLVDFNGWVALTHDGGGSFSTTIEIRRTNDATLGSVILSHQVDGSGLVNDMFAGMVPFKIIDRPGIGYWRYFVRVFSSTSSGFSTQQCRARYISATEFKTNV